MAAKSGKPTPKGNPYAKGGMPMKGKPMMGVNKPPAKGSAGKKGGRGR